jgi:hypothetical protein
MTDPKPIGRSLSIVLLGNVDREHPAEDEIAVHALDVAKKHGLNILAPVSGPYYEDGDERDQEVARLKWERDLAVAHDTQPYPTADAYDRACAALNKHRTRANDAEDELDQLKSTLREALRILQRPEQSRREQFLDALAHGGRERQRDSRRVDLAATILFGALVGDGDE